MSANTVSGNICKFHYNIKDAFWQAEIPPFRHFWHPCENCLHFSAECIYLKPNGGKRGEPEKSRKVFRIFFQKPVDKRKEVCYNKQVAKRATMSAHIRVTFCRCGGTGRRPGLKIPCYESNVPVRSRSPAPHQNFPYRGVEQLVARRAHNPEVVRFKSHPRNHIVHP